MYTINEVSKKLLVTRNSIVKKKEDLIKKGYMIIKNENRNKYEITEKGYIYLKEKRIKQIEIEKDKCKEKDKEYYIKLLQNIGNEKKYNNYHSKEYKQEIKIYKI